MKIGGAEPKFKIGDYVSHDKFGYNIQGRIVMFHHVVVNDVLVGYVYSFRTHTDGPGMMTNEQFKESLKYRDRIIEEKYIRLDDDHMSKWGLPDIGYLPAFVDMLSDI